MYYTPIIFYFPNWKYVFSVKKYVSYQRRKALTFHPYLLIRTLLQQLSIPLAYFLIVIRPQVVRESEVISPASSCYHST